MTIVIKTPTVAHASLPFQSSAAKTRKTGIYFPVRQTMISAGRSTTASFVLHFTRNIIRVSGLQIWPEIVLKLLGGFLCSQVIAEATRYVSHEQVRFDGYQNCDGVFFIES